MKWKVLFFMSMIMYIKGHGQCLRKQAYDDYQTCFVNTSMKNGALGWTGNYGSCIPGIISTDVKAKMITRINYFRRLAGVTNPLTHEAGTDSLCQRASLIMDVNNILTHFPPSSSSCYTLGGYEGANKSLLSNYSEGGPDGVVDFMDDSGVGNEDVGHRRWLLWPCLNAVGLGATPNVTAIYVNTSYIPYPTNVEYHSYPGKGYFPNTFVFDRWSFTMNGANFKDASVEMKKPDGTDITIKSILPSSGSEAAIIWNPASGQVNKYSFFDLTYTVTIKNILIGGTYKDITYEVILFKPTIYPPSCPYGTAWSENDCNCNTITTDILADIKLKAVSVYPNPFTDGFQIEFPEQCIYEVYSIEGICIDKGRVENNQLIGQAWRQGVYFINLIQDDGIKKTIKVIKQ